jgi:hypothetical protein
MRKERHKIIILAKKRNNRELKIMIDFNKKIKKSFGYTKQFILNPDE